VVFTQQLSLGEKLWGLLVLIPIADCVVAVCLLLISIPGALISIL
jgi:hypothetical protein